MRIRFSYLLLTLFLFSFTSLSAQKSGKLSGKIINNKFEKFDIISGSNNNSVVAKDVPVWEDGTFTTTFTTTDTDILRFSFNSKEYFLCVFSPGEKIYIEFDANNLSQIDSVSGSKSMEFVKKATDLLAQNKIELEKTNQILQSDEIPLYYNYFNKDFTPFQQINKEVDGYLIQAITTNSALYDMIIYYSKDDKIVSSKVDSVLLHTPEMLKSIRDSYQPYENYKNNIRSNYFFPTGERINGDDAFHADILQYMTILDERHALIDNAMDDYVKKINALIVQRDSLTYNGLLDNKKSKSTLANEIAAVVKEGSKQVKSAEGEFMIKAMASENLSKNIFDISQAKIKEVVAYYQKQYDDKRLAINNEIKDLLLTNKEDLAVVMLIDIFPKDNNHALHLEILSALYKKYPENSVVKERYRAITSPEISTAIGAMAPDLEFPNPDGKMLKLSDLRGKYVLLDFWAAWCGPCRKENPTVVKMYEKYKEKGFEVFSVSLDRDKSSWVKAIEADKLSWPNHVSDLKYWQSEAAKKYGVNSIPATFLIDKEGRIIAKNIRGNQLINTLDQIFK